MCVQKALLMRVGKWGDLHCRLRLPGEAFLFPKQLQLFLSHGPYSPLLSLPINAILIFPSLTSTE